MRLERAASPLFRTAALVVFCAGVCRAQPSSPWTIGASLGYGFANHSVTGVKCQSDCPQYNGGIGGGMLLGGQLEWRSAGEIGMMLRARYVFSSVTMQTITSDAKVKDENGNVVPWVRNYSLIASLPELLTDLSATYTFGELTVRAGGGVGFLVNPTWESSVQSISPGNVLYANHRSDTTFFARQPIAGANTVQFHLSLGAAYSLPVSHTSLLQPGLTLFVPLTSIRDVTPWMETIIELSVTLRFGRRE